MHIPDNFLSTPVWATLDALAIPAVGFMVKRAGRELEDTSIPLLGVMGAFVFAAQMINFPVGKHLNTGWRHAGRECGISFLSDARGRLANRSQAVDGIHVESRARS